MVFANSGVHGVFHDEHGVVGNGGKVGEDGGGGGVV